MTGDELTICTNQSRFLMTYLSNENSITSIPFATAGNQGGWIYYSQYDTRGDQRGLWSHARRWLPALCALFACISLHSAFIWEQKICVLHLSVYFLPLFPFSTFEHLRVKDHHKHVTASVGFIIYSRFAVFSVCYLNNNLNAIMDFYCGYDVYDTTLVSLRISSPSQSQFISNLNVLQLSFILCRFGISIWNLDGIIGGSFIFKLVPCCNTFWN